MANSSADTVLKMDLRSYQREGIAEIDKHIANGVKRILRQNYTGTGKSIEQLFLAVRHINENPRNTVLFLCPTEELIENLARYLLENGVKVSYIKSGRTTLFNSQVYIASVATLVKRLDDIPIVPTLIMADECFPAGTLVDGKPIEEYKVGDYVWSVPENALNANPVKKRVTRVFKNQSNQLVKIRLSNGKEITSTTNHPYYVKNRGWINAIDITENDELYSMSNASGNDQIQNELVESVEIYQQTSSDSTDKCDGGYQTVYNLEVEDYHTYFVEDILVHNCHHSAANTWAKCLNQWDCIKVGFSATPERLDGKPFTTLFDEMVNGKPYSWYIENGFLAPYRIAPIKALANSFRKRGGEYDLQEQQDFYNDPKIVSDAVKEWSKHCLGEKTVVFASGIDHSIAIAEQYNDFGMKEYGKRIAEHLDGSTPKDVRKEVFRRFSLPVDHPDSLLIMTNFALFIEGVNIPSCSVTQWMRLTASEIIYDQGNGRSNRFATGKQQTILDHVGNLGLHGLPDRDRIWSLEGRKAREATKAFQFICKGCNKLLAPDFRKLLKDDIEWIDCPSCDSSNLVPKPKKEMKGIRKPKEVDLDGELEFIDLGAAKTVNLLARFRKFQNLPPKKFFEKLIEQPNITLEDLKMACNFKDVSESYAYSALSKKMQNLMNTGVNNG